MAKCSTGEGADEAKRETTRNADGWRTNDRSQKIPEIGRRSLFWRTVGCTCFGFGGSFVKNKMKAIGLQLYTVRNQMEKDFDDTLAKVASTGYKEVEFAGYFNRTPQQVKSVLSANGLTSPSAHVSLKALSDNWQQTIETAATIGHRYLICAYLVPDERKSLDDYKRHADTFNRAGRLARAGIQFGYHNHDFEFPALDGSVPFDLLPQKTDANLVKIELDLYWIIKAKRGPSEVFRVSPGPLPSSECQRHGQYPKAVLHRGGPGSHRFQTNLRSIGQGWGEALLRRAGSVSWLSAR
jgi:hypothetical protein